MCVDIELFTRAGLSLYIMQVADGCIYIISLWYNKVHHYFAEITCSSHKLVF